MSEMLELAKRIAERAGKNAKVAPELLYAPILWELQDDARRSAASEELEARLALADELMLPGGTHPYLGARKRAMIVAALRARVEPQASADSAPMRSMTPQEEEAVQRSLLASGTPLYDLPQASADSAQSVAQYIGTLKDALRAARDELIKHDSEYHHFTDPFVKRLVFDAILSEPAHAQPQASADRDGFNKEDFADDGAYLARFSTAPTVPQSASEDWKQKYETEHARLVRLNEKYDNALKSGASEEPTDEGIAEAIRQTEYKYFGDYELSDGQWGAVYLLVNAAKHLIKRRSQAEIAK